MKKIICVLLAISLLFTFAACGQDSAEDKTSSKPSSSSNKPSTSSSTPSTSSSKPSTSSSNPSSSSVPTSSSQTTTPVELEKPKYPTSSVDVYGQVLSYELNVECKGYYFAPKAEGKYPTIIMIHGQGSVNGFKSGLMPVFNEWVKAGYFPPMVVVMPEVLTSYGTEDASKSNIDDFQYFIYKSKTKRFNALLTSIEDGTLCDRIGTDQPIHVSGFSMGGMAAVHAGAEYNDRIKYVAGLSPAKSFYLGDGNWGFYNLAKDIHFSDADDAIVYLAAGQGEQNGEFVATINRYEQGIKVNDPDIVTKYIAPKDWGGHSFSLAKKELFIYLFLVNYGKIPSQALVESVCTDSGNGR